MDTNEAAYSINHSMDNNKGVTMSFYKNEETKRLFAFPHGKNPLNFLTNLLINHHRFQMSSMLVRTILKIYNVDAIDIDFATNPDDAEITGVNVCTSIKLISHKISTKPNQEEYEVAKRAEKR